MSVVTNAILVCSVSDDKALAILNSINAPLNEGQEFVDPNSEVGFRWYGGYKALECTLGVCAFNYLRVDELIKAIITTPWEDPECVQLLLKGEDDLGFSVLEFDGSYEKFVCKYAARRY